MHSFNSEIFICAVIYYVLTNIPDLIKMLFIWFDTMIDIASAEPKTKRKFFGKLVVSGFTCVVKFFRIVFDFFYLLIVCVKLITKCFAVSAEKNIG